MSEEFERNASREWTSFIILAAILIGAIIVVALARPLIFNRIVPAVMGEGEMTPPVDTAYPAPEEPAPAYPVGDPVEELPKELPTENEEEMKETAVPNTPLTHIVQPGETLHQIARTYKVSVSAIIAANKLPNPNHIEAGQPLLIPTP